VTEALYVFHTGLYFGRDVPADSEEAKLPLHGPNQWPPEVHINIAYNAHLSVLGRSAAISLMHATRCSDLLPWEAPVMIAEKRNLTSFLFYGHGKACCPTLYALQL